MKLHDLSVGQRFTFSDKHRGKVFEVTSRSRIHVGYMDVATGDHRTTTDNRKTFRKEVCLITVNRVVELTPHEAELIASELHEAYLVASESGHTEDTKSEINKLFLKIKG